MKPPVEIIFIYSIILCISAQGYTACLYTYFPRTQRRNVSCEIPSCRAAAREVICPFCHFSFAPSNPSGTGIRGLPNCTPRCLAAAIPSFVLLLPAAFFGDTLYWLRRLDEPAAFWQVLATPVVISQACAGALVGAALIVLGLIFLRNMVRDYAQGKPGKKKR